MSSFIANARVWVAKAHEADDLGDDVDAPETAPADPDAYFPASIIDRERRVFDPSTGETRVVAYADGRVSEQYAGRIEKLDRLHDTIGGNVYVVDDIGTGRSILGGRDTRLTLRNVTTAAG